MWRGPFAYGQATAVSTRDEVMGPTISPTARALTPAIRSPRRPRRLLPTAHPSGGQATAGAPKIRSSDGGPGPGSAPRTDGQGLGIRTTNRGPGPEILPTKRGPGPEILLHGLWTDILGPWTASSCTSTANGGRTCGATAGSG
ncbi:hypothetical protein SDC9_89038 [bioreactor metagenome]|uniref:Uncharacterized protein n=1 Tax=bioreactor metagenome TaxID=1076179 RepID=A0A644ZUN8_9ZZZZ